MRQRRVVTYAGVLLLSCIVWTSALQSPAWAQASDAAIFVDRAICALDERQYDQALQELQEALRLGPNSVAAWFYQGWVYAALHRRADAAASWERARQLRPADIDVACQLGALYFADEQYDRADPLLRQVYQVEPTRPNLGYYLGFIEYRNKNYRRAGDYPQANVPSDDNFTQLTRFDAGLAMGALGFPAQARAEVEATFRLQPIHPSCFPPNYSPKRWAGSTKEHDLRQGRLWLQ